MIRATLHKTKIKVMLANINSITCIIPTPKFTLILFKKPKFLRNKDYSMIRHLNDLISCADDVKSQTKELKTANNAVKLLTKAMLFYIKHHANIDKQTLNCSISLLNEQNAKHDNEMSKLERLANKIDKEVSKTERLTNDIEKGENQNANKIR